MNKPIIQEHAILYYDVIRKKITPIIHLQTTPSFQYLLKYEDGNLIGDMYQATRDTLPQTIYGTTLPGKKPTDTNILFMTTNANSHQGAVSLYIIANELQEEKPKLTCETNIQYIKKPFPNISYRPMDKMPLQFTLKGETYRYGIRTQWNLENNHHQIHIIFPNIHNPMINDELIPDIIKRIIHEHILENSLGFEKRLKEEGLITTDANMSLTTDITYTQFRR